jgi:hypothetical protein
VTANAADVPKPLAAAPEQLLNVFATTEMPSMPMSRSSVRPGLPPTFGGVGQYSMFFSARDIGAIVCLFCCIWNAPTPEPPPRPTSMPGLFDDPAGAGPRPLAAPH